MVNYVAALLGALTNVMQQNYTTHQHVLLNQAQISQVNSYLVDNKILTPGGAAFNGNIHMLPQANSNGNVAYLLVDGDKKKGLTSQNLDKIMEQLRNQNITFVRSSPLSGSFSYVDSDGVWGINDMEKKSIRYTTDAAPELEALTESKDYISGSFEFVDADTLKMKLRTTISGTNVEKQKDYVVKAEAEEPAEAVAASEAEPNDFVLDVRAQLYASRNRGLEYNKDNNQFTYKGKTFERPTQVNGATILAEMHKIDGKTSDKGKAKGKSQPEAKPNGEQVQLTEAQRLVTIARNADRADYRLLTAKGLRATYNWRKKVRASYLTERKKHTQWIDTVRYTTDDDASLSRAKLQALLSESTKRNEALEHLYDMFGLTDNDRNIVTLDTYLKYLAYETKDKGFGDNLWRGLIMDPIDLVGYGVKAGRLPVALEGLARLGILGRGIHEIGKSKPKLSSGSSTRANGVPGRTGGDIFN